MCKKSTPKNSAIGTDVIVDNEAISIHLKNDAAFNARHIRATNVKMRTIKIRICESDDIGRICFWKYVAFKMQNISLSTELKPII